MNPEVDEHGAGAADTAALTGQRLKTNKRPQPILQRRLKGQISESRMLEVLDRQLRTSSIDGDPRHPRAVDSNQDEAEEELVCVSTMVAVDPSTAPNEVDKPVCGVLKTVRCMQRQRVYDQQQQSRDENQADHGRSGAATKARSSSPEV